MTTTSSHSDNSTLTLPHEETLDQTIASMNEAAGKTAGRQSPRKRKTMGDQDGSRSPSKPRLSHQQAQATPPPVSTTENERWLSRLRPKASTCPRHQYNRDDPFAPPEEESPQPAAAVSQPQKPMRKAVRKLAGRPADPSQLKAQGIISMPTNGVDLGDSPQRTKKAGNRTKVVVEIGATARTRKPVEGNVAPEQDTRRLLRKHMAQSSNSAAPTEQRPAGGEEEEAGAGRADGDDENKKGDEKCETTQETKNLRGQAFSPTPQQRQAAAGQAARQTQTLEAAEVRRGEGLRDKKETVAKLIQPIANIADLHGCRHYWEETLYSAHQILESRATHNAESDKGKRLYRRITYLKRQLRCSKHTQYEGGQSFSLHEPIEILKQRLDTFKTAGHSDQHDEQDQKAQDLHQLIIPELVFLLRNAVKARSLLHDPVFTAWRELIALMKLIVQAADMAYRWRPQPWAVLKAIKSCVFLIQKNLEKLGRRIGERIYLDEQARLSYSNQQRLNEEVRTRHEKLVRQQKQAWEGRTTTGVRASTVRSSSQDLSQPVDTELRRRHSTSIDIDDIDDLGS
ncbi:hypothetical protein DV736_g2673, partial [Chaetothyriales sp. CBS 134916]